MVFSGENLVGLFFIVVIISKGIDLLTLHWLWDTLINSIIVVLKEVSLADLELYGNKPTIKDKM